MPSPRDVLIYLLLSRLFILAAGGLSLILGYRLFFRGVFMSTAAPAQPNTGQDIDTSVLGIKITLKNAAPGTAFAIFGALIIIVMLVQSSPLVSLDTVRQIGREASSESGKVASEVSPESRPSLVTSLEASDKNPKAQKQPEAENTVRQTVTMRGEAPDAILQHTNAGRELEKHSDTAGAEREYRQALEIMAEPMNNLAWLYFKSGRLPDAVNLARLAVQLRPDEPRYADTLQKATAATRSASNGPQ